MVFSQRKKKKKDKGGKYLILLENHCIYTAVIFRYHGFNFIFGHRIWGADYGVVLPQISDK